MSKIDAMDDFLGEKEEEAMSKAEAWHSKRDVYTPYPGTFFLWAMLLVLSVSVGVMLPGWWSYLVYVFALLPAYNLGWQVFLSVATRVYKLLGGYDE